MIFYFKNKEMFDLNPSTLNYQNYPDKVLRFYKSQIIKKKLIAY